MPEKWRTQALPGYYPEMPKVLAVMTIGILHEPWGHPRVQGFVDRVPAVFEAVDKSDGFIDRPDRNSESPEDSWGPYVRPKCFGHTDPALTPNTLSLWKDIESLMAFAYHGHHGESMSKRREWFIDQDEPTFVFWWVEEGHQILWPEASDRLDFLHENGPTAFAFNTRTMFDSEGQPYTLDTKLLRSKAAANSRP